MRYNECDHVDNIVIRFDTYVVGIGLDCILLCLVGNMDVVGDIIVVCGCRCIVDVGDEGDIDVEGEGRGEG